MPSLRSAMEEFLEDWQQDVAPAWRDLLEGVEPAFDAMSPDLVYSDEIIFPGRKGKEPDGAPQGSHVFRALDGIDPADVRVVVIGQDPYPDRFRATGRAFEQGNISDWTSGSVASSLQSVMAMIAHYRTGEERYRDKQGGWSRLRADLESGDLKLGSPRAMFDSWQEQGVLFLNTGLTLTLFKKGGHPHQLEGHIPLWAPVVGEVCQRLAARDDIPLVFQSWGSKARDFLGGLGILTKKKPYKLMPGFESTGVVIRGHPVTKPYRDLPNLFEEGNDKLRSMGADPIDW